MTEDLFRTLNVPFESQEAASKAADAFFEDLGKLREKHEIANVYVITLVSFTSSEGERLETSTAGMYGDQFRAEELAAYALGHEQARRQERIASIVAGTAMKAGPRRA